MNFSAKIRFFAKPQTVVGNSPNFRDENQFRKLTGALYLETALRKAAAALVCLPVGRQVITRANSG